MVRLEDHIRAIPDFPQRGVVFRDLTPLLGDPAALRAAMAALLAPFRDDRIEVVAGMEARGFIFGALAAWELGAGFVPLRKPGKLPAEVEAVTYDLEYGRATLEVHRDALAAGCRVLIVDDVLATGGTAAASVDLVRRLGAELVGCAFLVELAALNGRARLAGERIHAVLRL
ncbi:MAG: adenine phosphoribosyltransferase [Proteobacteria bacterium]|nr:adenine phosphoribosyltransferase [Pseudomonadota bacterium]